MRITELLKKQSIALNADVKTKEQAFDRLISLHVAPGNITDTEV